MKHVLSFVLMFVFTALVSQAQEDKSKRPSPPGVAEGSIDGVKVKIDYSKPSAKGRKMIGGKEPFGQVWRTGANETTTFEVSAPVKIEGKDLPAGKYSLFTIPGETEWTIIINKDIAWGHYSYKEASDVLRVKVPAAKASKFAETFNIAVEKDKVALTWENWQVAFKVSKG